MISKPPCSKRKRRPCRTIAWSSASRTRVPMPRQSTGDTRRANRATAANRVGKIPEGSGESRRPAGSAWESGLDQSAANRVTNEPGGLVDIGLLHDARSVRLRGLEADPEQLGDFFGRLPLGDELQNLALARRQRVGRHIGLGQEGLHDRL